MFTWNPKESVEQVLFFDFFNVLNQIKSEIQNSLKKEISKSEESANSSIKSLSSLFHFPKANNSNPKNFASPSQLGR